MQFSRICDQELIDSLCEEALKSPRKRTHFEMHKGQHDLIQKFLNVMQPESYIPPHLHAEDGRWESFQIIQGRVKVMLFDEGGTVRDTFVLSIEDGNYIAELEEKQWHCIVALEPNSVLLELKPGPYDPEAAKHFAEWAPQEGDESALEYVKWFQKCNVGDRFPNIS